MLGPPRCGPVMRAERRRSLLGSSSEGRGRRRLPGVGPRAVEALERRGVAYAIRLPANDVLERAVEDLLTGPRGRPSHAPLVRYRASTIGLRPWTGRGG
jgi:hypothetical protein